MIIYINYIYITLPHHISDIDIIAVCSLIRYLELKVVRTELEPT